MFVELEEVKLFIFLLIISVNYVYVLMKEEFRSINEWLRSTEYLYTSITPRHDNWLCVKTNDNHVLKISGKAIKADTFL